jgi:uncharacterized membrane protein
MRLPFWADVLALWLVGLGVCVGLAARMYGN